MFCLWGLGLNETVAFLDYGVLVDMKLGFFLDDVVLLDMKLWYVFLTGSWYK